MMGSIIATRPSQPVAGEGIGAHQPEEQKSENKVDKIGHGATPPD
jgi:hypothetical protein